MNICVRLFCLGFFLFQVSPDVCGFYPAAGARAIGSGGAGLMYTEAFCAANNHALMPELKKLSFGLSISNYYILPDLNRLIVCAVMPYKKSAYGIKIGSEGNAVMFDRVIGLGLAHKVHKQLSFGIGANYHFFRIVGYGSRSMITAELSLLSRINDRISTCFHSYNLLGARFRSIPDEPVQRTFRIGLTCRVNSKVMLVAEAEKSYKYRTGLRIGFQYRLNKKFHFNTGISTIQPQWAFGLGFITQSFRIAFAFSIGQIPVMNNNISITNEAE
jgi:hypothetical protein